MAKTAETKPKKTTEEKAEDFGGTITVNAKKAKKEIAKTDTAENAETTTAKTKRTKKEKDSIVYKNEFFSY